MNLYLHNIGDLNSEPPIERADSLLVSPSEKFDYVLTNPPFGKKSSMTITNEDRTQSKDTLTYERQDFWTTTSNKQLNFIQHVRSMLKADGKVAVVVPDNVLFEGGAGKTVRKRLLESTDLHTILRLPTGIFYAQGVKANVIFFDNKPAAKTPWTKEVWINDLRTNIHFTLKTQQMKFDDLKDFVECYNPQNRFKLSRDLTKNGYPPDLIKTYVKGGWLQSMGYGVYKLADDNVDWYGGIYALQAQKESNIHPGGKTALIIKGYSHYLSNSFSRVDLFGNKTDLLPKWFKENDWGVQTNYIQTKMFDYSNKNYFVRITYKEFELLLSSPELAAMEMLSLVPKEQSFDEAEKIMEGLTTLRPQLVQSLLEECNSVKVKRLFLFMTEKHEHPWLKELQLENINLGSGKRVIVKNGMMNKKYNITVPREDVT